MKILVTGGAGFIGSNYIFHMRDSHPDAEIVCLDSLTYAANIKNLEKTMGENNFKFIKGSITDSKIVTEVIREDKFDAVVNFAAESHVDRSISNPDVFIETNIIGTQILMDACRRMDVERYHQVSTRPEIPGRLPAAAFQPVFCEQGRGGPPGIGLSPDVRSENNHFPLLQ